MNSITLATWPGEYPISVMVNDEGRVIKRHRNKFVASLGRKMDRTKPGSKRHSKVVMAKSKTKQRLKVKLRELCHQVSNKAAHTTSS